MCTLRGIVVSGIILAVIDIVHGLITSAFYCYQLVMDTFYLCPLSMDVTLCHNKIYVYEQLFERRVYIGIGEGIAGVIFGIIYIIALVKHKPSITWVWLMKAFGVIAVNVYYLASWLIRRGRYDHINSDQPEDEIIFIHVAKALTLVQIIVVVVFCLIGALFTYKVCEERTASRRNLRHRRKWDSNDATGQHLGQYDDDEAQYLNDALTNSEKTIPARSSKQSLTEISRADTFKHSTGV